MKNYSLTRIFLIICVVCGYTFGFPSLKENVPYCIYWKNQQVKLPLRKKGNVHLVDGKNLVFQFGTWTDANKTEYEEHYIVEIDSSKNEFFVDSTAGKAPAVYNSVSSYGGSGSKEMLHAKIKGVRASDSTWIINEWFSSEYKNMFGAMPYRLRKKDKRAKEGFKWFCKEVLN